MLSWCILAEEKSKALGTNRIGWTLGFLKGPGPFPGWPLSQHNVAVNWSGIWVIQTHTSLTYTSHNHNVLQSTYYDFIQLKMCGACTHK